MTAQRAKARTRARGKPANHPPSGVFPRGEEIFRLLSEESPLGISIIGKGGRYQYVNSTFIDIFGYSLEDIPTGKEWFKKAYPNPEYRKTVISTWIADLKESESGKSRPRTFKVRCKDGSEKIIHFRPVTLETGDQFVIYEDITERTRSEEELRENQRRLQELFDEAPVGYYELDSEGRITRINRTALAMLGWEREELLGRAPWEFMVERETSKNAFRAKITGATEPGRSYERTFVRKDGSKVPVLAQNSYMLNQKGEIIGLRTTIQDITKRKLAEELFHKAFHSSALPIAIARLKDGCFIDANDSFLNCFGYSRDELIGHTCLELRICGDYSQRDKFLEALRDGKLIRNMEMSLFTKSGESRCFYYSAELIEIGAEPCILSIGQDITERKQMEELLQESEEKFRTLAEESPNMIFINSKGKVVYANRKCEEVMGYTRDEFYSSGFDFLLLIAPESIETVKSYFNRHMRGEEVEPYEYSLLTRDNKRIEVILSTKLINYAGETSILGIITDITERKTAEEALRVSEEKYRELFESESDGVMIFDAETLQFEDANRATLALFGYSKEEFLSLKVGDISAEKEKTRVSVQKVKDRERGSNYVPLRYFRKKDGAVFPGEIHAGSFTAAGRRKIIGAVRDITQRMQAEEALRKREKELETKTLNLEEINTALKVLLNKREEDKREVEEKILGNVKELVLPYLGKLRKSGLNDRQHAFMDIVQSNLNKILSPFLHRLFSNYYHLTPTEIRVANLIKHDKTTKQIAAILNSSPRAINFHRDNIRTKLGLKNQKSSLKSYLFSIK